MNNVVLHNKIIEKLYNIYKEKGYVTEENVLNEVTENDLPLDEIDYMCDRLLSMGILIKDKPNERVEEDDNVYDRSQTDYEKVFKKVVEIDPSLVHFIDEVRKIKPPQYRECQNLILQAQNGNLYAKKRIIEMYMRVVIRIALQYYQKLKTPLAETIQEGCIGLIIAIEKYDINKNENFSTYAPWWIMQNINRETPTFNPLMYFPVHIKDKLFRLYNILKEYGYQKGNYNDIDSDALDTIIYKTNYSENEIKSYIKYLIPFESIEELMEKDESILSDKCITEEEILTNINKEELKIVVQEILDTLTLREKKILLLRFGLEDDEKRTLEEIGNIFCVTRERIRQIQNEALRKISHKSRKEKLEPFLDL